MVSSPLSPSRMSPSALPRMVSAPLPPRMMSRPSPPDERVVARVTEDGVAAPLGVYGRRLRSVPSILSSVSSGIVILLASLDTGREPGPGRQSRCGSRSRSQMVAEGWTSAQSRGRANRAGAWGARTGTPSRTRPCVRAKDGSSVSRGSLTAATAAASDGVFYCVRACTLTESFSSYALAGMVLRHTHDSLMVRLRANHSKYLQHLAPVHQAPCPGGSPHRDPKRLCRWSRYRSG